MFHGGLMCQPVRICRFPHDGVAAAFVSIAYLSLLFINEKNSNNFTWYTATISKFNG